MDKRAINIAFKDIQDDYQYYLKQGKLEDSTDVFLKFLFNHSLIQEKQLKRFFVIKMIDKNLSNNVSVTETINTIDAEYDINERTCWSIRKNNITDFRNKKRIS